ncbi:MAG: hypothetical protein C0606_06960 [Hyphomicrobiales bacterium]|nr:MAG: hypothetical protein C0606_06960 [Hyphomicrobiales bacterium]
MRRKLITAGVSAAFALTAFTLAALAPVSLNAAGDERELVELPAMMQEHMLGNMRDHLAAVNEILAALADDDPAAAGKIAEARLGMSSLGSHGAAHMAPFMPERMQAIGTEMHHAASRFVVAVQDADLANSAEGRKAIFSALGAVTETCVACHAAFRIH